MRLERGSGTPAACNSASRARLVQNGFGSGRAAQAFGWLIADGQDALLDQRIGGLWRMLTRPGVALQHLLEGLASSHLLSQAFAPLAFPTGGSGLGHRPAADGSSWDATAAHGTN